MLNREVCILAFSSEEKELAYRFIILPYVRKVVDRDIGQMENVKNQFKYPDIFTDLLYQAGKKVGKELHDIRKEMKQMGLSVYQVSQDELKVTYEGFSRGGKHDFVIMNHVLKNQVEVELRKILNLPYKDLREGYTSND